MSRARSCIILIGMALIVSACAASMPAGLGVEEGRLAACPSSPNCVSDGAIDATHSIAPLRISGDSDRAWTELIELLESAPRVRIRVADERYIHAECTTALMRYVDDLEFLRMPGRGEISVRSASRLGYGDLGVNRARVESIRAELAERGFVNAAR
jgi:uncharacterized protein (DUF1499 family)